MESRGIGVIGVLLVLSMQFEFRHREKPPPLMQYDRSEIPRDWYDELADDQFPRGFLFGAAGSAYQNEGAWNEKGKSQSVWDHATHSKPSAVKDKSNGDVAADSYHKYKEDIQLAKSIGCNVLRISLAWTRILPHGYSNKVNDDGIRFYDDVINESLMNKITPMVTIFHWDLPFGFQQQGGFTNPLIVKWFEDYARVAFSSFGDRVKHWLTINEPSLLCRFGYGGKDVPSLNHPGILDYLCGHYALLAHARVYRLYDREFRWMQKGVVGINLALGWYEPKDFTSAKDIEAAERSHKFFNGWLLDPIFGPKGDYPVVMKNQVALKSFYKDYNASRVPRLTKKEIHMVKGSADYLGINFHSTMIVEARSPLDSLSEMCMETDANLAQIIVPQSTPWAFGKLLRRVTDDYALPDVYVTANGYQDFGGIRDLERAVFHHLHLRELLDCLREGVNVRGYFVWSLLDGFEWSSGYEAKYGLFHVDYDTPNRTRTPKDSSKIIADVYKKRILRSVEEILNVSSARSAKRISKATEVSEYVAFCDAVSERHGAVDWINNLEWSNACA